jgi:hypothetical protein
MVLVLLVVQEFLILALMEDLVHLLAAVVVVVLGH